ncbi:MAG: hypothetical protein JRN09_04040 [Nitrososphaerota archaeon]|nr:hypothetical protein [Nitrososphaerota archaeon]
MGSGPGKEILSRRRLPRVAPAVFASQMDGSKYAAVYAAWLLSFVDERDASYSCGARRASTRSGGTPPPSFFQSP